MSANDFRENGHDYAGCGAQSCPCQRTTSAGTDAIMPAVTLNLAYVRERLRLKFLGFKPELRPQNNHLCIFYIIQSIPAAVNGFYIYFFRSFKL
jgi:hypothetical protein